MNITIPKGSHYSSGYSLGSLHFGTTAQAFAVKFSRECLALNGVASCDGDWNKLFGFSYGYHHSNSIRIAWKSLDGRIRIGAYIYEQGRVTYKGFATIDVDTINIISIDYNPNDDIIYFTCNEKRLALEYHINPTVGYNLKPYYGGNCNAPETMRIEMNAVPIPARALVNRAFNHIDTVSGLSAYKDDNTNSSEEVKVNIPNAIFWLIAHCIFGLVLFSFIIDEMVGVYGLAFGFLTYFAIQYRRYKLGKRSIFNPQ